MGVPITPPGAEMDPPTGFGSATLLRVCHGAVRRLSQHTCRRVRMVSKADIEAFQRGAGPGLLIECSLNA